LENDIFNIRYVKLHFFLELTEDCILPKFKPSALRGGIGEMLLRANCIRDRNCANCDFVKECIVRRTMYSQFEIQPEFVTEGDSIGYVLECEDYRREYYVGDILGLCLILFGKSIVYLSQYLQAVDALGKSGLGKDLAHFRIVGITNTRGEDILDGYNVNMCNYKVEKIATYIDYRLKQLDTKAGSTTLCFSSPLTQKYRGEILTAFDPEAIIRSIQRRVYLMDCFEGIDGESAYRAELPVPEILSQDVTERKNIRYSSRKDQKMPLRGISGKLSVGNISEKCWPYLAAGEVLHIGKNTSFGYGRYRIVQ